MLIHISLFDWIQYIDTKKLNQAEYAWFHKETLNHDKELILDIDISSFESIHDSIRKNWDWFLAPLFEDRFYDFIYNKVNETAKEQGLITLKHLTNYWLNATNFVLDLSSESRFWFYNIYRGIDGLHYYQDWECLNREPQIFADTAEQTADLIYHTPRPFTSYLYNLSANTITIG